MPRCAQRVELALRQETSAESLRALTVSAWGEEMCEMQAHIDVVRGEQDTNKLREHALAVGRSEKSRMRKWMALRLMVQQGADVNTPVGEEGQEATPIERATRSGDASLLRVLVMAGADVNQTDSKGCTLLYGAADRGCMEMVRSLLGIGADMSKGDATDGSTPLKAAANKGHLEVVRALVEAGTDANHSDTDGWTSSRAATSEGHVRVVRALLEAGASANQSGPTSWTTLTNASDEVHVEAQRLAVDFLMNYIHPAVGRVDSSADLVTQHVEYVQPNDKRSNLMDLLEKTVDGLTLVRACV